MKIDKELISHVAEVARLELTEKEIKEFLPQLKEILDAFSQIQKVDTKNTKPSYHAVELKNRLREDTPKKCLGLRGGRGSNVGGYTMFFQTALTFFREKNVLGQPQHIVVPPPLNTIYLDVGILRGRVYKWNSFCDFCAEFNPLNAIIYRLVFRDNNIV